MPHFDPFTVMLVLLVVLVLGIIGYFVYNLVQPKVTRKAKVTSKRKETAMSTAKCTFEFEDGQREEYDVSVDTYVSVAAKRRWIPCHERETVLGIPLGTRRGWRSFRSANARIDSE